MHRIQTKTKETNDSHDQTFDIDRYEFVKSHRRVQQLLEDLEQTL